MTKLLRFSEFIIGCGYPIAFYPQFKIFTHSTVATILLCQLLYWTQIKQGDWIYKTVKEWEDETGLTEQEQKTARARLIEAGILVIRWDNINKQMFYILNLGKMSEIWEEKVGEGDFTQLILDKFDREMAKMAESPRPSFPKEYLETGEEISLEEQEKQIKDIIAKRKAEKNIPITTPHTDANKKGDLFDMELLKMEAVKDSLKLEIIQDYIERNLGIVARDGRWKAFISFALQRQKLYSEDITVFTRWANANGFDAVFWSPEKCKTVWKKAFYVPAQEVFGDAPVPQVAPSPDALDEAPESFFEMVKQDKK